MHFDDQCICADGYCLRVQVAVPERPPCRMARIKNYLRCVQFIQFVEFLNVTNIPLHCFEGVEFRRSHSSIVWISVAPL